MRAHGFEILGQHEKAIELWFELFQSTDAACESRQFIAARLVENYLRLGKPLAALVDPRIPLSQEVSNLMIHGLLSEDQMYTLRDSAAITTEVKREVDLALMTWLLMKEDHAGFLGLYSETAEPGEFSQVETAARTLASDPKDLKGLLNAGYFLLHWGKRPAYPVLDFFSGAEPYLKARGLEAEGFRGPLGYFREIIDRSQNEPPSIVEAKALHYAIQCRRRSRYRSPWGNTISPGEPKEWFRRLHRKYKDSEWAQRTPYYYD